MFLGGRSGEGHEPVRVVGGTVCEGPLLHSLGHRVGDGVVKRLEPRDCSTQLLEDRLGQVLALGRFAEHVLAVDVLAGVLEVILSGGNLVVRDCLDGRLTSGHCDSYRLLRKV